MKQAIKLLKTDPELTISPASESDSELTQPRTRLRPRPHHKASEHNEAESSVDNSFITGFISWLKRLALYLAAVAVACGAGVLFLWQIPVVQDLPELIEKAGKNPPPQVAATRPATPEKDATGDSSTATAQAKPGDSATAETASKTDPNAQAVDAAQQAAIQSEVDQLLIDAQQNMDNRRLTTPASDNALSKYQQILELQPGNSAALNGIQRITAHYRGTAERSLRQGQVDQSLSLINRGLSVDPNDATLSSLHREALAARQAQQEREAALARERERKRREQAIAQERERKRQAAIRATMLRREAELQRQAQQAQAARQKQEAQAKPWWQQPADQGNGNLGGFNSR